MVEPRSIIERLASFNVTRAEYRAKLDQNESPVDVPEPIKSEFLRCASELDWNRYPNEEDMAECLDALSCYADINENGIFAAAGIDALILYTYLIFGGVGRKVMLFPPYYPIYSTFAELTSTEIISIPLNKGFQPSQDEIAKSAPECDIVIIANPNNPTGNLIRTEIIEELLSYEKLLVVIDEAYFGFCDKTFASKINQHPNLVILRSFSKALGMAGLRFGYCLTNPRFVAYYGSVSFAPYHLSRLQWALPKIVVDNLDAYSAAIAERIAERDRVYSSLKVIDGICPYPTETNFVLFNAEKRAAEIYNGLVEKGVLLRDFSSNQHIPDCLRATVGLPEENTLFLQSLKQLVRDIGY